MTLHFLHSVLVALYVFGAVRSGNLHAVLQWLGKVIIKERVSAKCEEGGNLSLLWAAATADQDDLMSYLLLYGADMSIFESSGVSPQLILCCDERNHSNAVRLLLSWGAELFQEGKQLTKE